MFCTYIDKHWYTQPHICTQHLCSFSVVKENIIHYTHTYKWSINKYLGTRTYIGICIINISTYAHMCTTLMNMYIHLHPCEHRQMVWQCVWWVLHSPAWQMPLQPGTKTMDMSAEIGIFVNLSIKLLRKFARTLQLGAPATSTNPLISHSFESQVNTMTMTKYTAEWQVALVKHPSKLQLSPLEFNKSTVASYRQYWIRN